jgi:hypothetical protein
MKQFVCIISLMLIFTACKDENSSRWTTVKVNVTNAYTGLPETGMDLFIQSERAKGSNAHYIAASGQTNNNGFLELGFKPKYKHDYSVRTLPYDPREYFPYHEKVTGNEYYITKGTENHYDLEVLHFGHLKLNLNNINCENENDQFDYHLTYEDDFDGVMKTHFFNHSYFGCEPQESPSHALNTGNYLLYWTVNRYGPHDNSGIVEIFIPEEDTLELTIEY